MSTLDDAVRVLRRTCAADRAGLGREHALAEGLAAADVRFAALGGPLQDRWDQAIRELAQCISPFAGTAPTLSEGGVYHGAWLESTGTISTEVLTRFAPDVTSATHRLYRRHQRDDGLMPYKVTADGPAYSQIQLVSPLARAVWTHHSSTASAADHLEEMYAALGRMERWLGAHRDTRGTGGVEAFCTFDTGHDLSPRFWNVPDRCHRGDATQWNTDVPTLPFVAPDLTAHTVSQSRHLALMASTLGHDPAPWEERAAAAERALWKHCWDPERGMFYDLDAAGNHVTVDSDVLLRVLACGVGNADVVAQALEDHLMRTTRFLSGHGLTSIAMDDPRFDADYRRNSWAGPVNMLTAIRAPHAFEPHGRVAELAIVEAGMLEALLAADTFPQCLDPWSGTAGFTEVYSPSILWFLDALERTAGVMDRPNGEVWLTALPPTRTDHGTAPRATAHGRTVRGVRYEIACDDDGAAVWRDGESWLTFPRGWRIELDAEGRPATATAMSTGAVPGMLTFGTSAIALEARANDRIDITSGRRGAVTSIGMVAPRQ